MKHIIIVGTGAVSAELVMYINDHNKHVPSCEKYEVDGFIEYEENRSRYWAKYNHTRPILGSLDSFKFEEGLIFILAVADIDFRRFVLDKIGESVIWANFIHYSVMMDMSVSMGRGNIIYPYTIIGPNVVIGDFNLITSYSFISHDCRVGSNNFFSTAGIAGHVTIGDNNFFGIRSTCLPEITIGSNNRIQAGMIVDKSINNEVTVFHRFKEKCFACR